MLLLTIFLVGVSTTFALDNGLAKTPPMGWLTWERFRCITDCKKYPNECISENLIKRTADLMVSEGYLAAGYEYLGIDDCWLEKTRGPDGRMVPDKERFPSGMKALADYIHSKGLKFGMYQDYGNKTCAGYPGVLGNEKIDIDTFVEWEIDYLKLDGCYINPLEMDKGYPAFGQMLNETGRTILYSCSWPAYQEPENILPDYASIAKHCNLWRNWDDIEDSWASLTKIMNWFGDNQDRLAPFAGPGHWNDPDMLLIGNFGLTIDQARVQMAVWAVLAAPLLMSVDLATIRPEFKQILLNKDIIAINQDPMGKQGLRVWKKMGSGIKSRLEIWNRELQDGSYALAFVSQRDDGIPYPALFTNEDMKLPANLLFEVKDLYKDEGDRQWDSNGDFEVRINPSGVKFYKFIPKSNELEEKKTDDGRLADPPLVTMVLLLTIFLVGVSTTFALDNGLAKTPPMGWLTWERFRCITDCKKYPNECISENLIKRTADLMVSEGYLAAGYEYLGIDDCWLEKTRGPDGRMVPDKERFPSGMKALADYIHSKGLKFGMYQDYGNKTCAGYPGVLGNEKIDIDTFVEWEIDYLKLDGCYINPLEMDKGYPAFGQMLNETGRTILYSCSWPAYQEPENILPDYASIAKHCNLWRNWDDIEDSWASLTKIMNWFGDNQDRLAPFAGPGHWNDPDMLLIGNFGLTIDQARVQMAVWAVLAAPLLMSVDLATIRPEFKQILLNKDIIAINQDPMGKQGLRVWKKMGSGIKSRLEIWNRELQDGSYALAFVSQRDDGIPYPALFTNEDMKLPANLLFEVKDLYKDEGDRQWDSNGDFEVRINPSGVKFYKFIPKSNELEEKKTDDGRLADPPLVTMVLLLTIFLVGVSTTFALDNGLAKTPPMGWLTWERFRCITDCKKYPNECISENLIKRTADLMVSEGYLAAGYEYLGIDDCWLEKTRGPDGRMVPDKERFPSGMKALADYIHSKGLKFGMYQDYGNKTCAGYPGVLGNEKIDIDTFVEWEIDYLKLDGCYINPLEMDKGYPAFGQMLNETGRTILYSCSWPAYQEPENILPDYASIAKHCNLWRNWDDIEDSWASLTKIMNWFGDNQDRLAPFAGPGHWNDPDMLLIGNFGLTIDQARVQMAVWAVLAAPLLMSVDLATIRPEFKQILLNKDIIAINQDPMGKQGLRVWKKMGSGIKSRLEIWNRELQDGSYALAFVSQRDDGIPYPALFTNEDMKLPANLLFEVKDLYKDEGDRQWDSNGDFEVRINPSGVKFYKFIPKSNELEEKKTDDGRLADPPLVTMVLLLTIFLVGVSTTFALDNGLAKTPPMGWLTWERFRCITDCKKYPNECISENLIKRTADLMVSEGYLAAGYEYLGIDDCWLEKTRGPDGRMVPDKERFPSGMKALADYIHSKGLKFGMYQDYGNKTCAGYPGVLGNEKIDIDTFVEWEIDYLKLDGCYINPLEMDKGYPAFGQMLNETGRTILYSCSWPAYQEPENILPDYASIAKHCNLWRNWDDIEDSWASLTKIMNWFGDNQDRLAPFAGPGHWNDPDMLLIGNFGLTIDQARVQMAVWAVLAAPLLMSVDLATIRPEFKQILLNKDIIAINQDPMGKQGLRVWKKMGSGIKSRLEIWNRELQDGSYALAFVSQRDDGIPYPALFTNEDMKLPANLLFEVKDLYKDEGDRQWDSNGDFEVRINPSGVKFYKFIPKSNELEEKKTDDGRLADPPLVTMVLLLTIFLVGVSTTFALDNGLAKTPPMGWLTWERFRCITDCKKYPNECISENLIKRTADLMVSEGYLAAGYEYLGIDDCWLEKTRGPDGRMVPDKERFPSGMKALADYIHSKGLKFGMYQDYGNKTCAGYPGVLGNEKIDIDTFVEWEIDYLKLDGCYINPLEMDKGYPAFGQMLNETGRTILYSCSWPAYQEPENILPDYASIAKHCNLWRNWDDIEDSWASLTKIMNWFGDNQDRLAPFAGPGHWNDPDMLLIGNFGLTIDQARVQMAVWAVLAAPLLMSVDLATIRPEFKQILLNKDIIAINQDPMGKQGLRVWKKIGSGIKSRLEIWNRELQDGSYALAFVSQRDDGIPYPALFTNEDMKLPANLLFEVKDLYKDEGDRQWDSNGDFEVRINPSGVKFYKFIPKSNELEEKKTDDGRLADPPLVTMVVSQS